LAVAHNFSITITNEDKTLLNTLDMQNEGNELRSFKWSADGKQLAILANITGNGNILITRMDNSPLQPLIPNSEAGYLMGFDWSRDGKQFVMWSLQNNTSAWLVNADGTDLREVQLPNQIFGTPQFAPDGTSILYYGANSSSVGLFEFDLENSQTRVISPLVEDETGFAFSPDGKLLAYMGMDRTTGEARLVVEELATGSKSVLATLPIPKGSGSTIPDAANLSWSPNGDAIIFEFGTSASDRVIYLAYTDGSGLVELAISGHVPAISADGNCLAYINDKQVFLIDLSTVSQTTEPPTPLLLVDLPVGNSIAGFKLDMLQWSP
jgi:TolB protein